MHIATVALLEKSEIMNTEMKKIGIGRNRLSEGRPSVSADQGIPTEIFAALEADQLDLPTLPDMAIKIRESLENPNISVEKLIHILSTDPVVTVHIIKAANSSVFHNGRKVDNLRDAISRLGYRLLYSMVMNITLTKLFQAENLLIDRALRKLWQHSREVAANCYVLAEQKKHLQPEVAMLVGLVHDIGALPLYLYADRLRSHLDQATLEELISDYAATIGPKLLRSWNFPDLLVDIVAAHENPIRINDPIMADYVDVLTMANLQMQETTKPVAWNNVLSAERLGYYSGDCKNFFSNYAEQIVVIEAMLGINVALPAKPAQTTAIEEARQPPIFQQQLPQSGFLNSLSRLFRRQ
jgi:HD-like signal output (HDOD) protein